MTYARYTKIDPVQTRLQIEAMMKKRGADQFYSGENGESAVLAFRLQTRHLRFVLPLKDATTKQKIASRWRALGLIVKAKLEAVDIGILTIEQAFMGETVMPDGSTVNELMLPQIESAYKSGQMPPLLEFHR